MRPFLIGSLLMVLSTSPFAGAPTTRPAAAPAPASAPAAETSEEYSYRTYKQQAGEYTLLVYSLPAFYRANENFLPLVIALGRVDEHHKKGETTARKREARESVTIRLNDFTLTDAQGSHYSPATFEQIQSQYKLLMDDKRLLESEPMVTTGLFEESLKMNVAFYPVEGYGPLRTTEVEMETFTAFETTIYFPRPPSGLGGILTLTLKNDQIGTPVSVKFKVPAEHKRKPKT